jgi:hypothetical protein
MSWLGKLKEILGKNKPDCCYVMVTIRPPWSQSMIEEIAPFWLSHELATALKDVGIKSSISNDLKWNKDTINAVIQLSDLQFFKNFPFFGCLIERSNLIQLLDLPYVEHICEIPDEYCLDYLRIVKGLHYVLEFNQDEAQQQKINIVNMSLQAPDSHIFEAKEAMNVATRVLTEHNITVVVAAGNFGPSNNTLNRWSVAPWVIGVGATDVDGKNLWEGSSRGIVDHPLYHPTVVAPGIDVVGARSKEGIYQAIDPQRAYCVATGTSFATPQVAGIAATCIEFIDTLSSSNILIEWKHVAELEMHCSLMPIKASPIIIKRMIGNMAVKIPNYRTHEIGEGFVNGDIANDYFNHYRLSDFIQTFVVHNGDEQNVVLQEK